MRPIAIALVWLGASLQANGAIVDPSFGKDGVIVLQQGPGILESRFGGYYVSAGGVRRMSPGGAFDPSFALAPVQTTVAITYEGMTSAPVPSPIYLSLIGEDAKGRLIFASQMARGAFAMDVAGDWSYTMAVLARVNRDGTLDRSFGDQGFAKVRAPDWQGEACYGAVDFQGVIAEGDDLYLAGTQSYIVWEGSFDEGSYQARNLTCAMVVKVSESGSLDASFGTAGKAWPSLRVRSALDAVSLDADGAIVLTGMTSSGRYRGNYDPGYVPDRAFFRARYSRSGQPLAPPVIAPGPALQESAIESYGIIRATETAGWIALTRFTDRPQELRQWDGHGRPVESFGDRGVVRLNLASDTNFTNFRATSEGGVYAVGTRFSGWLGTQPREQVVFCRWLSDGSPDRNVGPLGCADVPTGLPYSRPWYIIPNRDGSAFAVTYTHGFGTAISPYHVVRLKASPDVVEFHNTVLDHYFYAYDGAEAKGIDAGAAGPGWVRTSQRFASGGSRPTCRFYSTLFNSHFFTADPTECANVKREPVWTFEGHGFHSTPVIECAAGLKPIYRLYSARPNDGNHRFVPDLSLGVPMVARGWLQEGVAFCVRP